MTKVNIPFRTERDLKFMNDFLPIFDPYGILRDML